MEKINRDDVERLYRLFEIIDSKSPAPIAIIYTLLNTKVCHINGFYRILKINKGSIVNALKRLEKKGIIEKSANGEDIVEKETFKSVIRKRKTISDYHIKGAVFYRLNEEYRELIEGSLHLIESILDPATIEAVKNFKREIRLKQKEIEEKHVKFIEALRKEIKKLNDQDRRELRRAIEEGLIHKIIDYYNERYTYTDEQLCYYVSKQFGVNFSNFPRRVIVYLNAMLREGISLENVLQEL